MMTQLDSVQIDMTLFSSVRPDAYIHYFVVDVLGPMLFNGVLSCSLGHRDFGCSMSLAHTRQMCLK